MRNATPFAAGRRLDVLCLGRFAVDFYAQQIGARLEDVTSFAKYLGGSSANTAFGCARLGPAGRAHLAHRRRRARAASSSRRSRARAATSSHVSVDPARLTGAVVLGIKDKDTFPLIFLRENCADMAIAEDDIEEAYIAQQPRAAHHRHALLDRVHRPHQQPARSTARARNDVRTILDIDYRPVLWGLTKRGDGETRFIPSDGVTAHLQRILPKIDLVIGTIEEFNIAGGSTDIMASLRAVRARHARRRSSSSAAPMGCAVIDGAIPASLDDAFNGEGVDGRGAERAGRRRRVLGRASCPAGCAARTTTRCARYANACGALVVSRHGCAPAMPTRVELDYFLAQRRRASRGRTRTRR